MKSIRATTAATAKPVRHRAVDWNRVLTIALFLLPGVALYLVFVFYPVLQAAHFSVYKWNGMGPLTDMVGFDNYARLLKDAVFQKAIRHNLQLAALSVLVQLPVAMGMALLVGRARVPGRALFRTLFFLPFVLSDVVVGLIWRLIYNPQFGLFMAIVKWFDPTAVSTAGYLGNPDTVLYAIFAVMIWKYFGLHLVLYVTGLQQIPAELEEAARIDGAGPAQVFRHITFPLLGSTIRLTIYMAILGSLQYFDLIWIMTNGGPVNSSESMVTYLLKFGFQRFALGYGSAVAVVLFVVCFGFSLLYQRYVMARDTAGAVTSGR